MKWRSKVRIFTITVCVVYAVVFAWLFARNLTADTDYPFHIHNIWAFSQGYWINDPFINGGNWLTLGYGAPSVVLGALLYPLLGVFTVATLLALAFPALWHYSKQVFDGLASKRIAKLATFAVLLNPLTVYLFITAKLPFIWATCFGLMSVSFYLRERGLLATLTGVLAVITHPLAIFLFGTLFLINYDFRRWLKFYIPAAGVFILQLLMVFQPGIGGGGTTSIFYVATGFLAAALTALFLARKESRIPCTFGFALLIGAIIACFFGISIPTIYFDRIAWFVFILSLPFLIRAITPSLIKKLTFPTTVFALAFSAVLICTHAVSVVDNPSVYQKLPGEVTQKLEGGYTRYSTDGSALYLLPLDNVKFSNSGQEKHEQFTENVTTYRMQIERENASYILVYGESSEENLIHELNYELVYSTDNLKIYRTHLAPPYP